MTEIIPATCVTPDNLIGTNIFSLKKRQLVCGELLSEVKCACAVECNKLKYVQNDVEGLKGSRTESFKC